MNQLAAHKKQYTRNQGDLYFAFVLGRRKWKLGSRVGSGQKPQERTILAEDLDTVKVGIGLAKTVLVSLRRLKYSGVARLSEMVFGRTINWFMKDLVVDSWGIEVKESQANQAG